MFAIRRLERPDMDAAAAVHRVSFDARLPWLAGLHTPEEDRGFFGGPVFDECAVWGAWDGARLAGFIAFKPGWVEQLYVLPADQGKGIGARLLELAKAGNAELLLWTFQRNEAARRFYQKHGFEAIEETDGSGNQEREPDVLYRWQADLPMG
jgi:putative acetyltransferase